MSVPILASTPKKRNRPSLKNNSVKVNNQGIIFMRFNCFNFTTYFCLPQAKRPRLQSPETQLNVENVECAALKNGRGRPKSTAIKISSLPKKNTKKTETSKKE